MPGICQKKAHAELRGSTLLPSALPPSSAALVADNGYTPPTPMPMKNRNTTTIAYTVFALPEGKIAELMFPMVATDMVNIRALDLPMMSPMYPMINCPTTAPMNTEALAVPATHGACTPFEHRSGVAVQ